MTRNRKPVRTRSASDGPGVCATAVSAVAGRRTLNQRTGTTAQRAVAHGPALALGVRTNSVRSLTVAGLLGAGGGVRELALAAPKRRVPFFLRAYVSAFCVSVFCVSPALAQSNDGYVIKKNTIDSGGHTFHEGGGYRLGGTVGQHDAGDHAGGGYVLTRISHQCVHRGEIEGRDVSATPLWPDGEIGMATHGRLSRSGWAGKRPLAGSQDAIRTHRRRGPFSTCTQGALAEASAPQRQRAPANQVLVDPLKQSAVGEALRQRHPYLANRHPNPGSDLEQLEADGVALRGGQFRAL